MITESNRSHAWLIAALCLFILVGGYFFAEWFIGGRAPLHEAAPETFPVPTTAPVVQPDITAAKQIAAYTDGKPLPSDPPPQVYLRQSAPTSGHLRGGPDARVTMIEYSSLTNSYARVIHPALLEFLQTNAERMNWAFRHYPANGSDLDYQAAQAAECVTRQLGEDAFWRYLDLAFAEKSLTASSVYSLGTSAGADETKLRECVEGKELYDTVLNDKFHAQADSKIFVVPTFVFVNHETASLRVVEGVNTKEYMQAVLEELSTQ